MSFSGESCGRPPEGAPGPERTLEGLAEHLRRGAPVPAFDLDGALAEVGRDITARGLSLADEAWHERLVLYRELVVAVNRLAPGDLRTSRT